MDSDNFIWGQILGWGNRHDIELDDDSYNSWTAERRDIDPDHSAFITITDEDGNIVKKFLIHWMGVLSD